jgi:nucleotide-binding universal stress UspA family protein
MGNPLQCILAAARDVDSIVMATVGRTGLAHFLIGSVAEKVVRHSPVPVLTIRPREVG